MYRATGLHGAMPDSVLREIDCLLLDEGHPGNKIQVKCWTVCELSNHKLLISKSGSLFSTVNRQLGPSSTLLDP